MIGKSIPLTSLRRAFVDICNGYSVTKWRDKLIYIKHLGHSDHLHYDDLTEQFERAAHAKGLPSEQDRLVYLKSNGYWSDEKDYNIGVQEDLISRFEEGRKSISIPSILKKHDQSIQDEKDKLSNMITERSIVIGMTSEIYARRLLEDYYILHNLFTDNKLTVSLFNESDFEDLSDNDVINLVDTYSEAIKSCTEPNIRRLSVQGFFQQYYYLCGDDLNSFYGKPICNLTFYQVQLGNCARYFKNIFENNDLSSLSGDRRSDPDAIEKYVIAKKNTDQTISEGRAPVGMNAQDIKDLGLEGKIVKAPNRQMNSTEMMAWIQSQNKGS